MDWSFVDETRLSGSIVWCPLVDVGSGNRVLGLVPGSLRLGNTCREPGPLLHRDMHGIIDRTYRPYLPLQIGKVMPMDDRIIHAFMSNLSPFVRSTAAGVAIPIAASRRSCRVYETAARR